jgi:large subunit ribosomal protein L15
MKLGDLPKIKARTKKRIGRGQGSGKGKTGGRGQKGQKVRGKMKLLFEGGQSSLILRLPVRRGKDKNKTRARKPIEINVKYLSLFPEGTIIDEKTLIEKGIVDKKEAGIFGIKILGGGDIKLPITVHLPVSGGARKKIEAVGGKISK